MNNERKEPDESGGTFMTADMGAESIGAHALEILEPILQAAREGKLYVLAVSASWDDGNPDALLTHTHVIGTSENAWITLRELMRVTHKTFGKDRHDHPDANVVQTTAR